MVDVLRLWVRREKQQKSRWERQRQEQGGGPGLSRDEVKLPSLHQVLQVEQDQNSHRPSSQPHHAHQQSREAGKGQLWFVLTAADSEAVPVRLSSVAECV